MPSGILSNLNSAYRFGVQIAVRVKQGQTRHLVEALPLRTDKFRIGNSRSMHSAIGALSQPHTSAIVLSSSSPTYIHCKRNMAASSSVAASGDLVVDSFISSCGNVSGIEKSSGVYFSNRRLNFCQKASLSLRKNGEAQNRSMLCGFFVYDSARRSCNSSPLFGSLFKSYSTSSSTCYSNRDAPHVLSEGSSSDEKIGSLAISDDQKISGDRALKLLSGSCYLPHPDKEATGGEDAHFICADEQAVGVADGVGGWADVGVNAGEYSRQLMSNSLKAIQDEPKGLIDPAQVLEKAYIRTNAKGSSTACIIVLNDQGLHAINLGDSGFIVVRDGCTIFESPVQQHGFNFTYQLENSNRSDLPSAGEVFHIPVLPGDVFYLVGGCVRDLILQRIPKDFDIITSAELKEVMKIFSRCEVVGRRFPICHVHIDEDIVEVSSFSTSAKNPGRNFSLPFNKPIDCDEKDYMRWRNCLQRDFTINGLMFDPYAKLVYDYMGGVEDIRKAKVRTITSSILSLTEDCARILRAVRIAGRLEFQFAKETALAVKTMSTSVLQLDRGRILMEMNYMLAYGSAEASLRVLWRFGLLEVILPLQAAYFVRTGFRRRDKRSNLLLALFSNLDRYLAPDRPCHSSLWVAILAFHKALSDHPCDPLVVATLGLAVNNGGDLLEASSIAKRITKEHDISFPELLKPQVLDIETLRKQVMHLAAAIQSTLASMTDEYVVSQAMSKYPKAPHSDLVFIPLTLYLRVCKVFECVRSGKEKGFIPKQGSKIDHELLALGSLQEVRHVFARVVFDTVYPL